MQTKALPSQDLNTKKGVKNGVRYTHSKVVDEIRRAQFDPFQIKAEAGLTVSWECLIHFLFPNLQYEQKRPDEGYASMILNEHTS